MAGNLSSDDPRWDEGGLGRPHGGARNGGGAANGGPSFQDVSLDGSSSISKVLAHAYAHISAHAQPRLLAHIFLVALLSEFGISPHAADREECRLPYDAQKSSPPPCIGHF